ncbi:hypothetical protein LRP67_11080 [Nocardioides sp. cx-169]|uniref:hypothetical protein n=1 Tax=Nocardioides sp. cx-169 TaxID=2899080 RepID=UPI001E3A8BD1|nr:hypothetical protein [Nocardioides sp. cx-169]MCD4534626.1 hypothetical protein [Nocardioides sp. cx-169]
MSHHHPAPGDPVAATDAWFLTHGLTYFVPEKRASVRSALSRRRVLPLLGLTAVVAVAVAVALPFLDKGEEYLPAVLWTLLGVVATWYALTALEARSIVAWALARTFGSLWTLLPMMTRALPMLLVFVTFLFINAEVWEVASWLETGDLWLVALLFGTMAAAFLLVRLPEEVDRTDDDVDEALLLHATAGTPLEQAARELVDDPDADPASYAEVGGYERWNLILVLVVIQATQVLLLAVTVFGFFMLFGSLIMQPAIVETWTGGKPDTIPFLEGIRYLDNISAELVKVSVFLAAFSSLYLTVSTVTDETYRQQFFGSVLHEMEQAVGVRAVYLALRDRQGAESSERYADPSL